MDHIKKNNKSNIDLIQHTIVRDNDIRFAEFELGGEERNMPLPARNPEIDSNEGRSGSVDMKQEKRSFAELSTADLNFRDAKEPSGSITAKNSSETYEHEGYQNSSAPSTSVTPSYDGVRYYSREQQFAMRARELAWHVELEHPFVPFKSYWPTYDNMTSAQYKWYFYWREEVRSGRYPDSDLSYLFLYMYELINGIGWSNPAQGYQLLCNVWKAYRERYSKLDTYAREWLFDFSLIHGLDMPVTDTYKGIPRSLSSELKELEWLRRLSAQPILLNWDLLSDLMDYEPDKSRFYQEGGRKDMKTYGPKVVALVDAYLGRTRGQRLIELFRPREKKSERYVFRSAVYDYDIYGRTATVMTLPISEHPPLRHYITQLIRMMENKLRELRGFKGRLRGIEVEPEIEELVARFLKKEIQPASDDSKEKAAQPEVQIDAAKLRRIQQESDDVRDMLLIDESETLTKSTTGAEVSAALQRQTGASSASSGNSARSAQSVKKTQRRDVPLQMDIFELGEAVQAVQAELAPTEVDGLSTLNEDKESELLDTKAEEVPTFTVDNKNSTPMDVPSPAGIIWHTEHLDEEWGELASQLSPVHLEVLYALKSGPDMTALQAVAEGAGSMPALLIDEINEAAMETIGDLLIDGETLVDEYITMLDQLMR
ncbi:TerB N-terminal domain-containing protein [Paenibacillus sp. EC2-1]|uniref:TerB N-terminal domain-containing protein n=1 Tax=Paenibacillus sp. EC2-1 TaxID=3388665 RepID=UPI003BEEE21C